MQPTASTAHAFQLKRPDDEMRRGLVRVTHPAPYHRLDGWLPKAQSVRMIVSVGNCLNDRDDIPWGQVVDVMAVTVDPGGRWWVTRTRDGIAPSQVDVLDAEGAYVGTMDIDGWITAFVTDSLFVTVGLDVERSGGPVAKLHRLRPVEPGAR